MGRAAGVTSLYARDHASPMRSRANVVAARANVSLCNPIQPRPAPPRPCVSRVPPFVKSTRDDARAGALGTACRVEVGARARACARVSVCAHMTRAPSLSRARRATRKLCDDMDDVHDRMRDALFNVIVEIPRQCDHCRCRALRGATLARVHAPRHTAWPPPTTTRHRRPRPRRRAASRREQHGVFGERVSVI